MLKLYSVDFGCYGQVVVIAPNMETACKLIAASDHPRARDSDEITYIAEFEIEEGTTITSWGDT